MNPLAGKPLRYLIGADSAGSGEDGAITVVPYGDPPVRHGISVGYCNLFDELNTGKYGPYLGDSDTADYYDEGEIDPRGPGWRKNLIEQFKRRKRQGFEYIELDNADAYDIADVIGAIALAAGYGLKVIAKNPNLFEHDDAEAYVAHVVGAIVEKASMSGDPKHLDAIRHDAGKPSLPVWFVAYGDGRMWAENMAIRAAGFANMGVTYSSHGEYESSTDILRPHA